MIAFTRIFAVLMAAVVALGIVVPLALARHQTVVAVGVVVVLVAYVGANLFLWRRLNRRA